MAHDAKGHRRHTRRNYATTDPRESAFRGAGKVVKGVGRWAERDYDPATGQKRPRPPKN